MILDQQTTNCLDKQFLTHWPTLARKTFQSSNNHTFVHKLAAKCYLDLFSLSSCWPILYYS